MKVVIVDYRLGNLRSVAGAVERVGYEPVISNEVDVLEKADKLILPGVGAFGSMMKFLNEKNYVDPLKVYLQSNRPFLGICLGLQALFDDSEEAPGVKGLGFIRGRVKRFTGSSINGL